MEGGDEVPASKSVHKDGKSDDFYSYSSNSWQWDEQAVQSINQRMEGLAINAPAAKVASGKGFSVGAAGDTAASSSTY